MEETLKNLEEARKRLYRKLTAVGDFRRGTISVNYRRCGKANCSCTKKGHPGHGPQYLWNTTIKGKSYAKSIPLGPELEKYTRETDNYRKFMGICGEIIEIHEKICNLRPVPAVNENEAAELKKKLQRRFKTKYKEKLTVS
jgi:hypothetical protein